MSRRDNLSVERFIYSTMANTYTQIHIQAVFAVQNRQSLIQPNWNNELYKYMTALLQNEGHKLL